MQYSCTYWSVDLFDLYRHVFDLYRLNSYWLVDVTFLQGAYSKLNQLPCQMLRTSRSDWCVLSWLQKHTAKKVQLQRLSKFINNVAQATVLLMTECWADLQSLTQRERGPSGPTGCKRRILESLEVSLQPKIPHATVTQLVLATHLQCRSIHHSMAAIRVMTEAEQVHRGCPEFLSNSSKVNTAVE